MKSLPANGEDPEFRHTYRAMRMPPEPQFGHRSQVTLRALDRPSRIPLVQVFSLTK